MRRLIAAINMTVDGFCDHTAGIADDEIHQHYNDILRSADTMLFGRTTYQLMESYWPSVVANPTGKKSADDFAVLIDGISKVVYSRTLRSVEWRNTVLKREIIKEEIASLKQQPGRDILASSPSMIVALTRFGLIDEYHLTVHPFILGRGLPLFRNITDTVDLKLIRTKQFACGAVTLYYERLSTSGT